MSADFSPAFSAWADALEYVNDLTTKEILCMNEAWDAALEWERCRRIDALRTACENCGATERPDKCSGGAWCLFPVACKKQEAGAPGLVRALAYEEMVKAFEKWAEDRPAGGALTPFDAFAAGARWWHAIGKKS